jgi:hypothetical protein
VQEIHGDLSASGTNLGSSPQSHLRETGNRSRSSSPVLGTKIRESGSVSELPEHYNANMSPPDSHGHIASSFLGSSLF